MSIVLVFQITMTIVIFADSQALINMATNALIADGETITKEVIDGLESNLSAVSYALAVFCGVLVYI